MNSHQALLKQSGIKKYRQEDYNWGFKGSFGKKKKEEEMKAQQEN